MNKIRILSDTLANQIAAGEVVERPASVVKELVENSLDAGATKIQVEIEIGGRRLIRISDDGAGMSRDDSVLAFERHATSKIRVADDLESIQTLGFRGEALASIASVARVELITKTDDSATATRVQIDGGRIIDVKDAARTRGTTITVRDLFFNTPARRKFMRSESTENYHLTSIITHYALANPSISFLLANNGREVMRLAPAKDLKERAFQIFGGGVVSSLLEVEGGQEYVARIRGYISAPRERRSNRDSQYFFINGRFVRDKLISRGIQEGYRSVLPHGVYPVAMLFLDIPLGEVDVNVHPAKTEVRFRRSEAIKEVIAETVRRALESSNSMGELIQRTSLPQPVPINFSRSEPTQKESLPQQTEIEFEAATDFIVDFTEAAVELDVSPGEFERVAESLFRTPEPAVSTPGVEGTFRDYAELSPVDSGLRATKPIEVEQLSATKIRPIGQLHESYIIAVDDQGLLLIDQHVAHERILFDKFRRREEERQIESQNLLLPETFDLSPAQAAAFGGIEPVLESLGFGVMRLSGRTVAIKSVPADLPPDEVRNLFREVLDTVDDEKRGGAINMMRDEIAASLACKAAVKVNMKLTEEKMKWLIDNLIVNSAATTCPHGRPIILRLTMKDIERAFYRS